MPQRPEAMSAERQVRAAMENWAAAIRNQDVPAVMAHYGNDIVIFDLLPPLRYRGRDALKARVTEWLGSFSGPIEFEMRDLTIVAGNDVAYGSSLNRVAGSTSAGKVDMWWRATTCFRKTGAEWLITHGHASEPFEMQTGKALIDLRP